MASGLVPEWSAFLEGYDYRPAAHAAETLVLHEPPPGIVVHSGESGAAVAEWAWRDQARFFAHFAWSATLARYVQTCSMTRRAPHAGPYNGWLGVEMPGPFSQNPRSPECREATVDLVYAIVQAVPSVRMITGHQFIDHAKRDPGPGVSAEWWDGLGLEVTWRWVGRGLLVQTR